MVSAKGAVTAVDGHTKPQVIVTAREKRSIDSTDAAVPAKRPKLSERTDYSKWRMLDEKGRQTWHYLDDEEVKKWPQSDADKWYLGLPLVYAFFLASCIYANPGRTSQTYLLQRLLSIL